MGEVVRDGRALLAWGVGYAGFGAAAALGDTRLFGFGRAVGPAWLGWAVVAVGGVAALAGGALLRQRTGEHRQRGQHRQPLRGLLWALAALLGAAAFSLLMDVLTLLLGQEVDSWPRTGHRALAALGAVLLVAAARTGARRSRRGAAAEPSTASAAVQLTAVAGTLAFVPYAVMKSVWAFGGTFAGVSGAEMLAASEKNGASGLWLTLESWGLDPTALLAALGVFLLWGLVRPWGQVFPRWTLLLRGRPVPRWLPLAPALLGAATLAPYGLLGVGYCALATLDVVTIRSGDFSGSANVLLVSWVGLGAFAAYGVALTVAARSYWQRTRAA